MKNNQSSKSSKSSKGSEGSKKTARSWKNIIINIIALLAINVMLVPMLVYYGPFNNVKRLVVGTAMSSFKHQYLAKWFLSDAKIDQILNGDKPKTDVGSQNVSEVKVAKTNDKTIERYDINGTKFKGYLLVVNDPLRVKVGYTSKLGVDGQRTSDIAKAHNAVAAINGGGFTDKSPDGKLWAGTGGLPTGILMSGGKVIYQDTRDDDKSDVIAINKQGQMIVGQHSVNELKQMGVMETISFGPNLVLNGKAAFSGDGGQGITARTAIGQRQDGAILLLVLDGRQLNMPGATLKDVQKIMMDYHAYNAMNLDGGASTTMYYDGDIINTPCNPLGERTVATAIYVEP